MVGEQADDLGRGFTRASGGANILTRSVGSLGGVLGALGIAVVTQQLGRLSVGSVQTAGQLDQLQRAFEAELQQDFFAMSSFGIG